MHKLIVLLKKEFLQILRNRFILLIIFELPVIELLILPLAATYEMKNISLSIVDNDHSSYSNKLVEKFTASKYFKLTDYSSTHKEAIKAIEEDKVDIILEIPNGFERTIVKEGKSQLLLNANAIDGSKAGISSSYAASIINNFENEIREMLIKPNKTINTPNIEVTFSNWYNPTLDYPTFMVPGILVMLLSMVGGFLAALNIVSEKEKGTIEQINVTPIKKSVFILSKLIPFWIIGMIMLTIGLIICATVYHIIPIGGYLTIYIFGMVYQLSFLGLGLLISTYSENQQQAMFIAFFFMIIFFLLSGEFTPINSMPKWAQIITKLNPLSYFVEVMRQVMLKGSSFMDLINQFFAICCFGIVFNAWAIINYRKQS